jgi:hypothetical protein
MAVGVKVSVSDRAIISALNTPGGGVFRWRDEVGSETKAVAEATSPINDPDNAQHRDGVVGTYKAAWDWNRVGSGGHRVRAVIFNTSDHAVFVEYGRSSSSKLQIFTWGQLHGQVHKDGRELGPPNKVRTGGPTPRQRRFNSRTGKLSQLSKKNQAFNERISSLPPRIGKQTAGREGKHILSRAVVAVLGSQGISARTDIG